MLICSVEEAEDLTTDMLGTGLVVVHDTLVGGKDDNTELTRGKDCIAEVLELVEGQIETRRDDTALVEAAVEVDDDLAGAGIIDDLELADVAVSLHHTQELDQDLGDRAEDNLFQKSKVRQDSLSSAKIGSFFDHCSQTEAPPVSLTLPTHTLILITKVHR